MSSTRTTRDDGMYALGLGSGMETDAQRHVRIASRRADRIEGEIAARRGMAAEIDRARAVVGDPLRSPTRAQADADIIREMEDIYARRCAVSAESVIDAADAEMLEEYREGE